VSFVQREINITFTLGQGTFGTTGANSVKLTKLRCRAAISKAGGRAMSTLTLDVWGMTLSEMNQLSTLGLIATLLRRNSVIVEAGDVGSVPSTVFIGTITNAWFDGANAPDVVFRVEAHSGLYNAIAPCPPSTYKGNADAATILKNLATIMGLTFEPNGVSVQLSNPNFEGSAQVQAQAVAAAAHINMVIDVGVLAIWPKGGSRGGTVPTVSKETGMVGYPTFTSSGIQLVSLYNPAVNFGGKVKVESTLTLSKVPVGEWVIYSLDYMLEAMMPRGQWFMTMMAARPGTTVTSGGALPPAP
jgi:hypothetical protein